MKLIENWRSWYKMFSVQMLAVIAFVQGVLFVLPGSALDARVPFVELSWRDLGVAMTVAAAVLGGLGRLIDQNLAPADTSQ
jgi:hypothetical protein